MIFIILGAILLIEIGIKIYTHKTLKDFDGVGDIHDGGRESDSIHLK